MCKHTMVVQEILIMSLPRATTCTSSEAKPSAPTRSLAYDPFKFGSQCSQITQLSKNYTVQMCLYLSTNQVTMFK